MKLTVLYARVSSEAQNIKMQIEAAKPYMDKASAKNQLVLIDDGISANKVKINDRPELQNLLRLIQTGRVETLIVYDRDRLARNFYEYLDIAEILYKWEVQVVFTGTNVRPFDQSIIYEAIYAIFAQFEGQSIARRTADARAKFPSKMIGYNRNKSIDGAVTFSPDEKAEEIAEFFRRISVTTSENEFLQTLIEFKVRLGRQPSRLLSILITPFFAGVWQVRDRYENLNHVTPIISLELFLQVKEKLEHYRFISEDVIKKSHASNILIYPECGICCHQMKLSRRGLGESESFSCPKHPQQRVSIRQVETAVTDLINRILSELDLQVVQQACISWMNRIRANIVHYLQKNRKYLVTTAIEVVYASDPTGINNQVRDVLKKQRDIIKNINKLNEWAEKLKILEMQVAHLAVLITKKLHGEAMKPEQFQALTTMLIRKMKVYSNHIEFEVNWGQFFNKPVEDDSDVC